MTAKTPFSHMAPNKITVKETFITIRGAGSRRLGDLRREDCRRAPVDRRKQEDIFKQV